MHLIERAGLTEQVELRMADVEAEVKLGGVKGAEGGEAKHSLSSEKSDNLVLTERKRCAEPQDVCDIKLKAHRLVQRFL